VPCSHLRSLPGRQVDEGVWTSPSTLSQSPKKVAPETDFSKGLDLEMPTSPPVSLHHLTAATETLGMPSFGHSTPQTQTHPSKSNNPSRAPEMVPAKTQTGPETPSKKSADKAVSVEVRAWGGFLSLGALLQGLSEGWNPSAGRKGWESWGWAAWRGEGCGETLEQPGSAWRGCERAGEGLWQGHGVTG